MNIRATALNTSIAPRQTTIDRLRPQTPITSHPPPPPTTALQAAAGRISVRRLMEVDLVTAVRRLDLLATAVRPVRTREAAVAVTKLTRLPQCAKRMGDPSASPLDDGWASSPRAYPRHPERSDGSITQPCSLRAGNTGVLLRIPRPKTAPNVQLS